jgi:hypothetical protein
MKILSKSPSRRLVKLQGELKVTEKEEITYVVQPKSSRNLNAARKPLVVQLWASRYRELYPL